MMWVIVALGALFVAFMAKEAATSVLRSRRVARLGLSEPPLRAHYLAGCAGLGKPQNLLIGRRGDELLLIDYASGVVRETMHRTADVAIMSRAEYQNTPALTSGRLVDDGDTEFTEGMDPGIDFQGTKNALARADTVCVFAGVAVVHSDRAAALRLKMLVEG